MKSDVENNFAHNYFVVDYIGVSFCMDASRISTWSSLRGNIADYKSIVPPDLNLIREVLWI